LVTIAGTDPFFGKLSDRFDRLVRIAAGLINVDVPVSSLPLLSSFTSFLLQSALLGPGVSISTVATSVCVADVAGKEHIGASMRALSSVMDIRHSAVPFVTGIIISAVSYKIGFLAGFLPAIFTTAAFIIAVKDRA